MSPSSLASASNSSRERVTPLGEVRRVWTSGRGGVVARDWSAPGAADMVGGRRLWTGDGELGRTRELLPVARLKGWRMCKESADGNMAVGSE